MTRTSTRPTRGSALVIALLLLALAAVVALAGARSSAFGVGIGGGAFGAEHYVARAAAARPAGATSALEQTFYLLVPEGP